MRIHCITVMVRSIWGSLERRGPSWEARWTDPFTKKPRRKVVGKVAELGEHLNESARRVLLDGVRAGVVGAPGCTFGEFLAGYAHVYRMKVRPRTFQTTMASMRLVDPMLPGPMDAIDIAHAEAVLAQVAARGFRDRPTCANTVRLLARRLAHFWRAAQDRGVVRTNVWVKAQKPAARKRSVPLVDRGALDAIVAVAPEDLRPLVRFLGETGLRVSEAAALRWQDVHGGHVRVTQSKSDPRLVKLTRDAMGALAELGPSLNPLAAVFPVLRTHGRKTSALARFQRKLVAAMMPKLRFHDLRHGLGQRLALANQGARKIGDVLGITEDTAKVYMQVHPQEMADAAISAMETYESEARKVRKAE